MSIELQVSLIVATVLLFFILIRKVKRSKLRADYATGWILCSMVLIVIAVFPQIAYLLSDFLHVMSPANIIFAIIILLLIILVNILFFKVSTLEEKQKCLAQELALLKEHNNLKINE